MIRLRGKQNKEMLNHSALMITPLQELFPEEVRNSEYFLQNTEFIKFLSVVGYSSLHSGEYMNTGKLLGQPDRLLGSKL